MHAADERGPFNEVDEVYQGTGEPMGRLKRMWMLADSDQISRTENYVVPLILVPGKPHGKAELGAAVRLEDDRWGHYSRIVPVEKSPLFVQAELESKVRTTIRVLDPNRGTRALVGDFPSSFNNDADWTYAIARSGSHVLLISPERIALRDVRAGLNSDVEAPALLELRRSMIRLRKNPGEWRVTNDLRYILAAPSRSVWTSTGESGSGPMPTTLEALAFDLDSDAVVYDRQTRRMSIVPVTAEQPNSGRARIADFESVAGELCLLYLGDGEPIGGVTTYVANASGRPRASHVITSPRLSSITHFAGWSPECRTVWFRTRDSGVDLPNQAPAAAQHLIEWNYGTNSERRYDISAASELKATK